MDLWIQIIINLSIGLVTGILSSYITNHVIDKRILNKLKKKDIVMNVYLTLRKYENKKIGQIGISEISDFLIESSVHLKNIRLISELFEKARGDIVAVLRLGQEDSYIVNVHGENYFNLIQALEKYLEERR